jgi:hypothetical protein
MKRDKILDVLQHFDLIAVVIPIAIVFISLALPLRPFVRQALIGIVIVWFGIEAMTGFHFWK